MPKRIPEYRKKAIAERQAKGIKTRKRRKDYTDLQWATHLKAQKRKYNKEYWIKAKDHISEKLGYKKKYIMTKPIWWICDYCGNEFKKKPRRDGKYVNWQFCSVKCAGKNYYRIGMEARKLRLAKLRDEKAKFIYQIVITDKYIQKKTFDKYINKEEAFDEIEKLLEENKKVLLPRKYFYINDVLSKSNDELLLLKLDEEGKPSQFPNEYGKLIDNLVDSKSSWVIINKYKWNVEDKFHHVGVSTVKVFKAYCNDALAKYRDKDVKYITDNLILKNVPIHIFVYDCYLIIKYDEQNIELIYAPHKSIIIELYTYLNNYCKKNKIFNVTFMGSIKGSSKLSKFYDEFIYNKLDNIYNKELEKTNETKEDNNNERTVECT
jgi:hypothetical protein